MVEIIAVPFDLCGPHHGSRLGALAMHLQGLDKSLHEIGLDSISTDSIPIDAELPGTRAECDARALRVFNGTRDLVATAIGNGRTPVVIGGDHSIAIGSISGALAAYGDGLAVLWIDAHMDLNTPDTSPSGNLHGMSLSVLAKLDPELQSEEVMSQEKFWANEAYAYWPRFKEVVPENGLGKNRIAWLGLRDVDSGEVTNFRKLPGSIVKTMHDIDSDGLLGVMQSIDRWLRETDAKALWISFDVDVLDPIYAPGTGTAVRGGLTYREGHLVAETLSAFLKDPFCPYTLAGLDVVEVNPLRDDGNKTAIVAIEWLSSLFGKTIMHQAGS